MATTLGKKLKELRQQKGYSLDELAALTDTSKSYLWELENRDQRKPSGEKLNRIAIQLDVTANYLLDDNAAADDEMQQEAFFRKFNSLTAEDRDRIEQMMDTWAKKK